LFSNMKQDLDAEYNMVNIQWSGFTP